MKTFKTHDVGMIQYIAPDGLTISNPDIADMRTNMIDNFSDYWKHGNGSATINFFIDKKIQNSILVFPSKEYGIYLKYLYITDGKITDEWVSIENPMKLNVFTECCDEWYVSIGLFLPLEKAWKAIQDFWLDGNKSKQIYWINTADMPKGSNW